MVPSFFLYHIITYFCKKKTWKWHFTSGQILFFFSLKGDLSPLLCLHWMMVIHACIFKMFRFNADSVAILGPRPPLEILYCLVDWVDCMIFIYDAINFSIPILELHPSEKLRKFLPSLIMHSIYSSYRCCIEGQGAYICWPLALNELFNHLNLWDVVVLNGFMEILHDWEADATLQMLWLTNIA